ncbi:MAG: hypothetical protein J6W75_09120 [Bacteroidaceae bacterium]|nr:hypothetical protein [Bacteroidaceae bacterium]
MMAIIIGECDLKIETSSQHFQKHPSVKQWSGLISDESDGSFEKEQQGIDASTL